MFHLFLATIAVTIVIGVTVFGLSAIDTSTPLRMSARVQAATSATAIQHAVSAYKVANRGAMPPIQPDTSLPLADLGPYLPAAAPAPSGTTWSYLEGGQGSPILCLSGANVAKPVFDGLLGVQSDTPASYLAHVCTDAQANAAYTPQTALIFPID